MEKLRQNSPETAPYSWEDLYKKYKPLVRHLIKKRIPAGEREDVCQDIFMKIFRNMHLYDPTKSSLNTWITIVTQYAILDCIRTYYRKIKFEDKITAKEDLSRNLEAVDNKDLIEKIKSVVSPEEFEMIKLRYMTGMTGTETAKVIGVKYDYLISHCDQIKNKIKKYLDAKP